MSNILIKTLWCIVRYVSEATVRICCASIVTISDWFEKKIEQSQRRTTKLVKNIKHKNYEERLFTLNFMLTLDRRDRSDMIMTYNIISHRVEMAARFMNTEQEDIPRNLK